MTYDTTLYGCTDWLRSLPPDAQVIRPNASTLGGCLFSEYLKAQGCERPIVGIRYAWTDAEDLRPDRAIRLQPDASTAIMAVIYANLLDTGATAARCLEVLGA